MSLHFDLLEPIDANVPLGRRSRAAASAAHESAVTGDWSAYDAMCVVQRIFLPTSGTGPKLVTFAGVDHADRDDQYGRVALSVAQTLAGNAGGSVCLVDANPRSPRLEALLGKTGHAGLTDALLGQDPISSFVLRSGTDNLWLLPAGPVPEGTPRSVSSERFTARLAELRKEFNYVLLQAPPLDANSDALSIAQTTDGIVLVLEAGSTRREVAQLAVASLRSAQIPILGAVLNGRKFPIPASIYKRL